MTGECRIEASREDVWQGLNDPEILRQSITGCEEIDQHSDTEFSAKVTAKVGPVKAKFSGLIKMTDLDPPSGYKISGEGKGGAAGFAKGGAEVKLRQDGAATILSYTVSASVGGKLAQLGGRLIDATARKYADEFFAKFKSIVEGEENGEPVGDVQENESGATAKGGLNPAIWIILLVIIFAAITAYFGFL